MILSLLITVLLLLCLLQFSPSSFSQFKASAIVTSTTVQSNNPNATRTVILTFDDNFKSQITNVKPILDEYGYKATFFIICNYVGRDNTTRMNWQDILTLQKDGMDIESHTMNHKNLNKLWPIEVDYEVGQSKQCLHSHGINATIMATPYNEGWNNSTVVNSISKYYQFARSGNGRIMYLHCDGWPVSAQKDCRTYSDNGALNFANRYSIRAWSHNFYDNIYQHNETSIFNKFIRELSLQSCYNAAGEPSKCRHPGVPIIEYHNVDNDNTPYSTTVPLFDGEMKYLHTNGIRVIPMSFLGYNSSNNFLYLRQR